jgi:DNA-binding transcriptional ArsR family regulator
MTVLEYLLPSKARQGLVTALLHEQESGSVSDLARRAGVTPAAAQKEVDQMLSAGLVVSERDGRRKVVRANARSPQVRALRKLLDQLEREPGDAPNASDELVRAWLGHYGAPLLVSAHVSSQNAPPFEETFVRALGLAHRDATVAEVLPLVLWTQRHNLNLAQLARLATKHDEAQSLGLFLDLTGALARDRALARAAETLRDGRYRRMRYFFTADARTELSRAVARMHTPKAGRRWHFFMNMPFEGFASHFRKFTRAESVHS